MKLSVVIPTYNRRRVLERSLPSLLEQDFPVEEYEVVIVVDGSTDGTGDWLRSLTPACGLRVLEQPNGGQAAAMNAGLNAGRGELVLFLDDDILCSRTLIREHVAAHEGGEDLFVFGPVLVAPESPFTLATDWTRANTEDYTSRLARDAQPQWPQDMLVDANSSAPRSKFIACGGFDEAFVARSNARSNADFGLRLWSMGVKFRYQSTAVTHQIFVKSARDLVDLDARWFGRNEVLLCRKHSEYRPYSPLASLGKGPLWKRLLRQFVLRFPISPGMLLIPPFWAAERFRSWPALRRLGIRLLQARQGIAMYRGALAEAGSWTALRAEFGMRIPVLLYHHVGPPRPGTYPELTVSAQRFARHIRGLARQGYTGICSSDLLKWRRTGKGLPKKPVLLTFDDAYFDLAEYAFPVLERYGFPAAVFVVTKRIGSTNAWDVAQGPGPHRLLNEEQLRAWSARGIEFGAHSRTHPDLTTLAADQLIDEVAGSAEDLAAILGARAASFAYPYGYHNQAAREGAKQAFALGFSVEEGLNGLWTDLHCLRRTMVQSDEFPLDLAVRLRLGWSFRHRLHGFLARKKRRLLGQDA